ncbi:MAG: thioredoxin [Subtercola sp.]|nr:thioredoxin [Subtercola sp.]
MRVQLYSSSFCGACTSTRAVLDHAAALVNGVSVSEVNVAVHPDAAERADITATPTVIIENDAGEQVFRAEGVPTINQVLTGLALAL